MIGPMRGRQGAVDEVPGPVCRAAEIVPFPLRAVFGLPKGVGMKAEPMGAVVRKGEGGLTGLQLAQAGRRRVWKPSSFGLYGVAVVA